MNSFLRGFRLALPLVMGYLPVGFAFGLLAVQAGMTPLTVGLMSYFVYAGSAQLIATGLLSAHVDSSTIIVTTFVVNLRHMLMSAALTPYLRTWTKPLQAWFSFEMTDETFAVNLGRFSQATTTAASGPEENPADPRNKNVDKAEALGINCLSHLSWTAGGVAGAFFDSAIGDVKPFGLDFALPGMFIALVLPHLRLPRRVLAVCFGAALSLLFAVLGARQWNVMLATICAATIAALWPLKERDSAPYEKKQKKASHV